MRRWPGKADKQKTTFGDLTRSELMKRVRSSGNRTTELTMVRLLRKAGITGWRRHLHLLARPDIVWPKQKVMLFIDGCFWHGHDCGKNIAPKTNAARWREKIEGNKRRDCRYARRLRAKGWRVIHIWECQLKKKPKQCLDKVFRGLRETGVRD